MVIDIILANVRIDTETGCWLWTGKLSRDGYARYGRNPEIHRLSYAFHNGEIPADLEINHPRCRVRHCVNPDHLEAVPHTEVVRRSEPARKTHCKNGHLFDEQNTYWKPDTPRGGRRQCRACNRAAAAALTARKAAVKKAVQS